MSSRKEEERNEKIIRGLMKLPPNRKCINCNSLGPQYVCTNFWTFICITCSGIHREFTHRVKSVSMAKFTLQEVDALQRGGNQRAREMFLKDWDMQQQRLPDSSNLVKIREFIKNVYVDRKYAGGKSVDKPPRDTQNHKNHEEDHRRASSYHSFSQSPPYENQYEDRRYGKQTGMLNRKPGSDRGHYEGKISSFVYSPGRLGDRTYEFANEGSFTRVTDYSVSSTGDPLSYDSQSPNFHKGSGFNSPPVSDILAEDMQHQENAKRVIDGITHSQRTVSSGSFGSLDSNSNTIASANSNSLFDVVLKPGQSSGTQQTGASPFPCFPQSSGSASAASLDLFSPSFVQPPACSSAPTIDLFADMTHQNSTTYLEQKPPSVPLAENEGWATFDLLHKATSTPQTKHEALPIMSPGNALTVGNLDMLASVNDSMQWSSIQSSTVIGRVSPMSNQWHGKTHEIKASNDPTISQPWNAFDDSTRSLPEFSFENLPQKSEPLVPAHNHPTPGSSEDFSKDAFQRSMIEDRYHAPTLPFDGVITGSSFPASVLPLTGGVFTHIHDRKSTNPFDLPYDSDFEPSNTFLDMNSLQTALPNSPLPNIYLEGVTEPWFPQNSVTPYISATSKGGLAYMAGQAPSSQLPNLPSQGPVASLGGNPFA